MQLIIPYKASGLLTFPFAKPNPTYLYALTQLTLAHVCQEVAWDWHVPDFHLIVWGCFTQTPGLGDNAGSLAVLNQKMGKVCEHLPHDVDMNWHRGDGAFSSPPSLQHPPPPPFSSIPWSQATRHTRQGPNRAIKRGGVVSKFNGLKALLPYEAGGWAFWELVALYMHRSAVLACDSAPKVPNFI